MSANIGDLLLLLRLRDGRLRTSEAATVRERLAVDRELRLRWKQVSSIPQACPEEEPSIDPDTVAAWVDQNLTDAELVAFEAECFKSPALLFEVARISRESVDEEAIPDALSKRLLSMGPAVTVPVRRKRNDVTASRKSATSEEPPKRSSRRWTLPLILAGVLIPVCIALLMQWLNDPQENIAKDEETPEVEQKIVQPDSGPAPRNDDNTNQVPPSLPEPPPTEPRLPSNPTMVNDDTPKEDSTEPLVPDITPKPKQRVRNGLAVANVTGVLTMRNTETAPWRGALAKANGVATRFATLPGSRAELALPNGSTLVLGPATEVAFPEGVGASVIDVRRGNAAVRDAPPRSTVTFVTNKRSWDIATGTVPASIAMKRVGNTLAMSVRKGVAEYQGKKLRKNTSLASTGKSRKVSARDTAWIDAWDAAEKLDSTLSARLMRSSNVQVAVARMPASLKNLPLKMFVTPGVSVLAAWKSDKNAHREAALKWLAATPVDAPAAVTAWQAIETDINADTKELRNWCKQWQAGAKIRVAFWNQITRAMNHNDRPVRHTAWYFLRRFFPDKAAHPQFKFNVNAKPDTQLRSIRAWNRWAISGT